MAKHHSDYKNKMSSFENIGQNSDLMLVLYLEAPNNIYLKSTEMHKCPDVKILYLRNTVIVF